MDTQFAMTVFVEVARTRSFAGAARRLGLSTTATSRHVGDLERMLGVTLLRRTTRQVSPTEAGARYLPRAAAILEEIDRLNAETSAGDRVPRGTLRITAPPGTGRDWIAPLALDFLSAHPDIDLDIDLSERVVDLVAEGFDAAIRSGPLPSSTLVAHRIIELHYRLCASPSYLERRRTPARPEDLAGHDLLYWRAAEPAGNAGDWTLALDAGPVRVPVRRRLLLSDLGTLRAAALRGLGLAILPTLSIGADLAAGRLVALLPGHEIRSDTLSLVRPPTPFMPARLRVFIDFVTAALRDRAWERP